MKRVALVVDAAHWSRNEHHVEKGQLVDEASALTTKREICEMCANYHSPASAKTDFEAHHAGNRPPGVRATTETVLRTIALLVALGLLRGISLASPAGQDGPSAGHEPKQRDLQLQMRPQDTVQRPVVPRGYSLVIGIGQYRNLPPSQWLRYSESDAEAMYRVLISQQGGAFPAENVHKLIGAAATAANVRRELEEWLPSVAGPADRVVVYFAGHGFSYGGTGYLATYDIDPADPKNTGLPMQRVGAILSTAVKARWKALFVDACHSGKITPQSSDEGVDQQISALPSGFLTFSSTRERELSFEDPQLSTGFGLFTYYLVQGLAGLAESSPCDGVVTADELIDYVRTGVQQHARKQGVIQTPTEHGDFDNQMVFAANPVCVAGADSAPPTAEMVIESTTGLIDVYVDGALIGAVSPNSPLRLPGLRAGAHIVKGVRKGYEPETKEVLLIPGQQRTLTLRVEYRREFRRSAVELVERGEALLFKQNSALDPTRIYGTGRQGSADLLKAKSYFGRALEAEPAYSKAAYDFALTCQQLSQYPAMMEAFRKSISIDPSNPQTRTDYAGALIENGDPDEAVRQLTEAARLEPTNDLVHSHLSRAYLDKGAWKPAIEAADRAITLNSANAQAYLWKGDALRRAAAGRGTADGRQELLEQALNAYAEYLRLTRFRNRFYETATFYLVGFHAGGKSHADRETSYAYQQSVAFMGLCDVERQLGSLQQAVTHCKQAVKYDPHEPMAYFFLASAYRDLYNATFQREYLRSARSNYAKTVEINPDLALSRNARDYVEQIDVRLALRRP